jgi:glycosyltransferase involved in cell wall biosynthesis
MISFIVIGRNEAKNLSRCLKSIYGTIFFNNLASYEIIYVDSKSTDESVNIVQEFKEIKVIILTGDTNAAIGRNVGAIESKGNILFFIDADMEIDKGFISDTIDKNGNLEYEIVSGQVVDIIKGERFARNSGQFLGGIFLIKKPIWQAVDGMKTKYKTGEDLDLGLRSFKKGFPLKRKIKVIANHYTVYRMDRVKTWKMLWNKSFFYARAVLYRDHLFNRQMYALLWRNDKTAVILSLLILCCLLFPSCLFLFFFIYLLTLFLKSKKQKNSLSLFESIIFFMLSDSLNVFYFFAFYPKNKKVKYVILDKEYADKFS